MKIKTLMLLALLICTFTFSRGQSQYAMMTVDGTKQGKFKGESLKQGNTDKTEVIAYTQEIKSPRDIASGQASGKRQHQPLTIWKVAGATSPQFFQAVITNEVLRNVTIEYYKTDEDTKTEVLQYKIELTNATVSNYRQIMGMPESGGFKATSPGLYEEISFTFQKITVSANKTSATDDWRTN
jgi:type VI secretion system secreted protein Hcp